jgi:hypothetical protein
MSDFILEYTENTESELADSEVKERLQTALSLAGLDQSVTIRETDQIWTSINIGDNGIGVTLHKNPSGDHTSQQPLVVDEWWTEWTDLFDNEFAILNSLNPDVRPDKIILEEENS